MERLVCAYCLRECGRDYVRNVEETALVLCLKCFHLGVDIGDCSRHFRIERRNRRSDESQKVGLLAYEDSYQLILAVERYGYGNWKRIQASMGLPNENIASHCYHLLLTQFMNAIEFPRRDYIDASWSPISIPLPPSYCTEKDQQDTAALTIRDDFENEFLNEIEPFLDDIRIGLSQNESDHDRNLKIDYILLYESVLRQRRTLKQHIRNMSILTQTELEDFVDEVTALTAKWSKASLRETFSRSNGKRNDTKMVRRSKRKPVPKNVFLM